MTENDTSFERFVRGELGLDEMEAAFDDCVARGVGDLAGELGMTRLEWTAFGHGIHFDEVRRWRLEGWPVVCAICGGSIAPEAQGWFAVRESDDAPGKLVHISECLAKWSAQVWGTSVEGRERDGE